MWRKIIRFILLLAMLLSAVAMAVIWYFGAWNIVFPSRQHDSQAPWVPGDLAAPAVLIFSKTNSYRHVAGIEGGNRVLREIAIGNGWGVYATENGAIFNEGDLQRFAAVVFLNANGDMLSVEQEGAFQKWLLAGGGWIGIHAAGDGSHTDWPWYMENLVGAQFTAATFGPQFQRARVVMASPEHPVVQRLPNVWMHTGEWYSWRKSPRANGFTILAVLDEASYSPVRNFLGREKDLHMDDHPVVWTNCVGRGRTLYTALGHTAEAYKKAEYRTLLEDALRWTMRLEKGGC
jgi:type 1 glutamine amidotransferase